MSVEGLVEHVRLVPGGGAIWDLAVSMSASHHLLCVAVACDDGCVRFITPDPEFVRTVTGEGADMVVLPVQSAHYLITRSETTEARALSVAWAPPDVTGEGEVHQCVACGDAEGGLRWIDPRTGRVYGRGKIPGVQKQRAMIWTLQFTREGRDVVCGDSRGMVTVWASATNTIMQELRIEGLKSAIWSSAVVNEGAGVDTVFFGCAGGGVGGLRSPVVGAEDELWVPLRGCHFHSHDVRGMASFPNGGVVSGSFDARICVFTPQIFVERRKIQWVLPYPSCVGQSPVQFCRKSGLILSRRREGIDVWSIPEKNQTPLLKLRMKLKSFKSGLIACAISENGQFVAASSVDSFRLYRIWDGDGEVSNSSTFGKVRPIGVKDRMEMSLRGSVDLGFCGRKLVCISGSKEQVAFYEEGVLQKYSVEEIGCAGRFLERIACSDEGVAVCDSRGELFFSAVKPDSLGQCPSLSWTKVFSRNSKVHAVTALAFSPSKKQIAIASSDLNVYVRRVNGTKGGNGSHLGPFRGVVTSLSFSAQGKSLLISGETFCCVTPLKGSGLKKRKHGDGGDGKTGSTTFMLETKDSILGSSALDSSRLVVVRRPWNTVHSSLPRAIPKKPFGS